MKLITLIIASLIPFFIKAQSPTEKEVMWQVILDNFSTGSKNILVTKETSFPFFISDNDFETLKSEVSSLDTLTFLNFLQKKDSAGIVNNLTNYSDNIQIKYIDSTETEKITESGFWNKEIVAFTRVGFNKDQTQALICYSAYSCSLCGAGWFCVYKIKEGKWVLVAKTMAWIS